MSKYKQGKGKRGSLKWVQRLVNEREELFRGRLVRPLQLKSGDQIEWVSPLAPHFTEFRDADFLKEIHQQDLAGKLREFWPKHGPQWDALGLLGQSTVLLVEAKAHIAEVFTTIGAKAPSSRRKIEKAFQTTRDDLDLRTPYPWTAPFYQYANRVAHLHFLHNICRVPTYLIFVNFMGDTDMDGPRTKQEWQATSRHIKQYLGVGDSEIVDRIVDLFVNVDDLKQGKEARPVS